VAKSASFIDGVLHLEAEVDGQPQYLVASIHEGAGYVVETHPELLGSAHWAPVDSTHSARLRSDATGTWVDVISTNDGWNPGTFLQILVDGEVPERWQEVFTVVDYRVITCVRRAPGDNPVLATIDSSGAVEAVLESSGSPCSETFPDGAGMAFDGTFVEWRTGQDGGLGGSLRIRDVQTAGAPSIADYNYSPDGIHAYGSVTSAASDGATIVFDIGNDSRFFAYELGSGATTVQHAWFGLQGPKKLLGVLGGNAYVATAEAVHVFAVSPIPPDAPWDDWPAPLLGRYASVAFGEGLATPIASDDAQLLVVDAEGRLYLVPARPSGEILPMRFYAGAPVEGCDT
jgi:hypothetical protein